MVFNVYAQTNPNTQTGSVTKGASQGTVGKVASKIKNAASTVGKKIRAVVGGSSGRYSNK